MNRGKSVEMPTGKEAAKRGFTLIELLVVIAIIAILASLLLPALSRAKMQAYTIKCQNNLRNLGQATYMYASDFDDFIPRDIFGQHQFFANKLSTYVAGPDIPREKEQDVDFCYNAYERTPVYRCPSVEKRRHEHDPPFMLHYTINSVDWQHYEATGEYRAIPTSKMNNVPGGPARVVYITEINDDSSGPMQPKDYGNWDIWNLKQTTFGGFAGVVPNSRPRMIKHDDKRHGGKTDLVFLDGHTETRELTASDLPIALFNPLDKGTFR